MHLQNTTDNQIYTYKHRDTYTKWTVLEVLSSPCKLCYRIALFQRQQTIDTDTCKYKLFYGTEVVQVKINMI